MTMPTPWDDPQAGWIGDDANPYGATLQPPPTAGTGGEYGPTGTATSALPVAPPPARPVPNYYAEPRTPTGAWTPATARPAQAEQAEDPITAARRALALQQYRQAMRGSPGVYREGGWTPRSSVEQRREEMDPETVLAIENAARARAGAEAETAIATANVAHAQAVAAERQASDDLAQVEADRARRQEVDRKFTELMAAHDQESQALAESRINPSRWFDDRNAGGKIAAIVGTILYGLGGGNPLELIQSFQDRDIDAQKSNMELRRQGVAARETAMDRLQALYGSPQAAEAALRERQLQAVKQRIDAAAAKGMTSDVAAAQIRQVGAAVDEEIARQRAAFEEATLATVEQQTTYDPGGYVGGRAPDLKAADAALAQYQQLSPTDSGDPYSVGLEGLTPQQQASERNSRVARAIQLANGETVFAPTEVEARELRGKYAQRRTLIANLERVRQVMESRDWQVGFSRRKINDEIRARAGNAMNAMRKSTESGASLTEAEMEAIRPFTGESALSWASVTNPDAVVAQLDSARRVLEEQQEADLANLSTSPIRQTPRRKLEQSKVDE